MVDVTDIFVGRQKELATLDELWHYSLKKREHRAYVIFNAPGVGKTTLLKKFGEILETEKKGVHFHYVCKSDVQNRNAMNKSIFNQFQLFYTDNYDRIEEYIEKNYTGFKKKAYTNNLEYIHSQITEYLRSNSFNYGAISELLLSLSAVIPIFFSSDEVQVFEQIKLPANEYNPEETLFHYYTKLIANLLNSRILLIMTGTQYHILQTIGDKIGSPIRDKADAKVISPLSSTDIHEYCVKLNRLVAIPSQTLEYLESYLQTYCGGHARTIQKIVEEFLTYINKYSSVEHWTEFVEEITVSLEHILIDSNLTAEKKGTLMELQSRTHFVDVRQWFIHGVYTNLKLGHAPRTNNIAVNHKINDIVYSFMTVGLIVQNGNNDYYITSYFHYLTFLQAIIGEYENFLLEVMNNKFFRMLVGGHSGFGYTFENVLFAALIVNNYKLADFPLQVSQIEQIKGQIDYTQIDLQNGQLYHTPSAKNVDGFILHNNTLIVLQITTKKEVPQSKVDKFYDELRLIQQTIELEIQGWFISLFDLSVQIPGGLNVIQGADLVKFMGENIYKILVQTKTEL